MIRVITIAKFERQPMDFKKSCLNKPKPTVILHMGWPKTSTTYLQEYVFPAAKGINYIGKPFSENYWWTIEKSILLDNDKDFKNQKSGFVKFIAREIKQDVVNVISHEGFIRVSRYMPSKLTDQFTTLDRLYSLFKDISELKFLFFTRQHVNMLYSYFNQFLNEILHYGITLNDVFEYMENTEPSNCDVGRILDSLKYGRIIKYTSGIIGADNVGALAYEEFSEFNNLLSRMLFKLSGVELKLCFVKARPNSTFIKDGGIRSALSYYTSKAEWKKIMYINRWLIYFKKLRCRFSKTSEFIPKEMFQENEKIIKRYYKKDLIKINDVNMRRSFNKWNYL